MQTLRELPTFELDGERFVRPDFSGRGLANIAPTVLRLLTGKDGLSPLPPLDPEVLPKHLQEGVRHVVLLIADGLGEVLPALGLLGGLDCCEPYRGVNDAEDRERLASLEHGEVAFAPFWLILVTSLSVIMSPSATKILRSPTNGSRACATSILSSDTMSPACHWKRTAFRS